MNRDLPPQVQSLDLHAGAGRFAVDVNLRMTPSGLLAVGGLVGTILLGVAAVVWTATSVKRQHPLASALGRR